ncbi:MAG TPA: hypothetical protein VKB35_06600, partial [Ktedonobacteraceae bacterium]|nr:hypothetical protein [Ktedonobacteraceae bacterium]
MSLHRLHASTMQARASWLSIALISALIFLSSCSGSPAPATHAHGTSTNTPKSKIRPSPTRTSTGGTSQPQMDLYTEMAL